MNWSLFCIPFYCLVFVQAILALCAAAAYAEYLMEEAMKCEICGKRSEKPLARTLRMGPRGYRQYQACPGCQAGAAEKTKKAVKHAA